MNPSANTYKKKKEASNNLLTPNEKKKLFLSDASGNKEMFLILKDVTSS